MKRIELKSDWPESWKISYQYDLMEVFGQVPRKNIGYANSYQRRQAATFSLIDEVLHPGASILDVAGAQGNFSLLLAEKGYTVTWNDLRDELENYVRLKFEKGNLNYLPGNVFEIGIKEQFDCVLITEIIEHVAHPDQFLKKIAELVRPGGYIVMTTPLGDYFLNRLPRFSDFQNPEIFEGRQFSPNSDGHIFLIHEDEFQPLAEKAGLTILSKSIFTNPLTTGHLKSHYLLRFFPRVIVSVLEIMTKKLPLFIRKKIHVSIAVLLQKTN